jgi:hypothetical protein
MRYSKEYYNQFINVKFGKLIVIEYIGCINNMSSVKAICECGVVRNYSLKLLKSGGTKSCGCGKFKKHGLWLHKLYKIWIAIKDRCYNQNNSAYRNYGAIGVKMCEEWKNDFKPFYDWCIENGWVRGLEIDKDIKAKELGVAPLLYSPEMCSIVTHTINNRNRRDNYFIEFNGFSKCLKEWSDILGISYSTICARKRAGWGNKEILTTPIKTKTISKIINSDNI